MIASFDCSPIGQATASGPLRVFGVGAAGVNLLEAVRQAISDTVSYIAVDADAETLSAAPAPIRLHLDTKRARDAGTGGDAECGRTVAEENLAALADQCRGAEVVVILAGLGGGAGSGISPVLARAARQEGALALGCAVTPFECEGSLRQHQADVGLAWMRAAADGVVCLPNQKIARLIDEHTSLMNTFKAANDLLVPGLSGLLGLLGRRGLIPIHLDRLCAALRGRHAESALAAAETHGPNRALDVVEKILAHPLLDGGQTLAEAETVIVSISGGPDLSMADLNRVMEQIHGRSEQAEVLMGASVSDALRDRLSVTVIATARSERISQAAAGEPGESAAGKRPPQTGTGDPEFLEMTPPARNRTRLVPPAPNLPPDALEQRFSRQGAASGRSRKVTSRMRQGTLPLDVVSRGRFDKTEPNIHRGEDLDTPTYLRRGLVLN